MRIEIADLAITAVHYEQSGVYGNHRQIATVEVRSWAEMNRAWYWSRERVVAEIKISGTDLLTARSRNKMWIAGDRVGVVRIKGIDYIRTDGNRTEADNLGSLPEF